MRCLPSGERMPSTMIFPGMDPYLEDAVLWGGVHATLIVYVRNYLQPLIRPRYIAAVEERVYLEGPQVQRIPDVWVKRGKESRSRSAVLEADAPITVRVPELEVHETYVTILDRYSSQKLVTLIEVVSPTNKNEGPGRESYETKQKEIRQSSVHLVEIDLLRQGNHVLAVPEWKARDQGAYDYLCCVNRGQGLRDEFDLYPQTVRQRLPRIAIPLQGKDPDVVLDVQAVLEEAYADGAYGDRIDYRVPCRPPLADEDQTWANELIAASQRPQRRNGSRRR